MDLWWRRNAPIAYRADGTRRRGAANGGGARRRAAAGAGAVAGRRTAARTVRVAWPRHAMARVSEEGGWEEEVRNGGDGGGGEGIGFYLSGLVQYRRDVVGRILQKLGPH